MDLHAMLLQGSFGMGALIDDTAGLYVTDDTPNAETRYRARFYFDPNSITMTSGDTHYLFKGYQGTSTEVIRLEFRFSSGSYQVRAGLVDNGSTWSYTSWFTISDASHYLEWDWRAASSGGLTLWLDGAQQADLTNITNDTRVMDRARLGPLSGLDTGTSGTYYFDSFESRRANYIGPMAMGNPPPVLADTLPHLGGGQGGGHFASYHLAPPQQGGTAFTPVADAYVAGDATTTNYGASTTLRADASPDLNSYLRFDVQGLTGSVTSATLRIYANSSSSVGYDVYAVTDNTWTETGITYSNAPTMGTQLGSSGTFSANVWTTVDVTSYITGNGMYNLAFTTTSNTNTSFSSREGANPPELVIVTSGGAASTPTATNTPGPSPTPTRTPTPGASNTPTVTPTTPPPFQSANFVYDGDGKRVKSTFNGTNTTYFVGAHYEVTGSTITKYYYAGAQRIAMRSDGTLNYLLGDHLGSTSLTTDASGNIVSELRYKAWGEVRYASGDMPTKYQFNGQYSYVSDFGLMFYNARWVDVSLGRFAQADSIIPQDQGVQAWDRYAYTNNNPVRYTDPTGNCIACAVVQWVDSILNPSPATWQAVTLVTNWATESGPAEIIFGPEQPITQEVMEQKGVDDFHQEWANAGYPDNFTADTMIDNRNLPVVPRLINWSIVLIQSHFIDLPLAISGDENHSAIPGTIGSLDEITATYTDDGKVLITVHNTMGRASFLRISTWKPLRNVDRSESWWGGTTEQYFYWFEDRPKGKKGAR